MPNILEFVRGLLTDAEEQEHFAENPQGYVTTHGFADLSGEDVTEAVRRMPQTVAGGAELPPARPQQGETEIDAAVRQLRFAISLSPAAGQADRDTTEPEPQQAPAEPDHDVEHELEYEEERESVSVQPDRESTPVTAPTAGRDPYTMFGDEMAAIVRNATEQMQAAVARAESTLREAEREAEGIREAARVDAQTIRGQANEEAGAILESARSQQVEAASALETARLTLEEAQRDATEIATTAERESGAMLSEARAKRGEILAAEQELRKQLQGVQSVFESLQQGNVAPDDNT